MANTHIYLLSEQLQPVPIGVPGELYSGGRSLARGYLHRADSTAEKFIPDPFSNEPGARLYKTGDLARYRPDGTIEFLGRLDQQVKLRGYRIELGEIEAVLRQHPAVAACVVVLREEDPADKRLVAYLVARPGAAQDPDHDPSQGLGSEVQQYLQDRLPAYMLPSAYVLLPALPLTPSGKVDRRALPDWQEHRLALTGPYAPPQTELERIIAAIWCEVLAVAQVGVHDTFFDLGGHSLLAIEVHRQLQERLGRHIALIELFKYPTVGSLAQFLNQKPEQPLAVQKITQRTARRTQAMQRQQSLRRTHRPPHSQKAGSDAQAR